MTGKADEDRGGDHGLQGIRAAEPQDLAAIRACAADAYRQYVAAIGRAPAPMVADFEAQIASGSVHVALDRGSVIGFVVFYQQDAHVMLENVAVMPDAMGQGVGKRLIAYCEEAARHLGATAVRLYTNEKMTANLRIYPHLGYRETGRVTEDGFSRVYFEKAI